MSIPNSCVIDQSLLRIVLFEGAADEYNSICCQCRCELLYHVLSIARSGYDNAYGGTYACMYHLLFGALKEEEAFKQLSTWNLTEGLEE